jgi:hypothetical protein
MGASCKTMPEDKSAFASTAGQSTIVAGACATEFNLGWPQCLIESGANFKMPVLRFVMTNPGEWAVSDCGQGIFKSGGVDAAGVVEIDLAPLSAQALKDRLCILKIETFERYKDQKDSNQTHQIYMRGGFFIEVVDPGYFPTPSNDVIAFCVKVARTTKGRTKVENCKP